MEEEKKWHKSISNNKVLEELKIKEDDYPFTVSFIQTNSLFSISKVGGQEI